MTQKFTSFLVASTFSAALVFAQTATVTKTVPTPASMAEHRVSFLTTLLSLTADQQQQATTIFTNAATTGATFRTQEKTAHENLKTAIQNNDAGAIEQNATAIGTMTGQSTANEAKAEAAFYQILTAEQKTKYNQLAKEHRFGGPGTGTAAFRHGH